jgi:hypothetical protein
MNNKTALRDVREDKDVCSRQGDLSVKHEQAILSTPGGEENKVEEVVTEDATIHTTKLCLNFKLSASYSTSKQISPHRARLLI